MERGEQEATGAYTIATTRRTRASSAQGSDAILGFNQAAAGVAGEEHVIIIVVGR